MTVISQALRHAALHRLLQVRRPDLLQRNRMAWQAWVKMRQADLPDPSLSRIHIVVPIQTIQDVALYPGLLQLLQVPGLLPLVVLVLPDRTAARLAWIEAMLEGWASLVTIESSADWAISSAKLPATNRLVSFRFPGTFCTAADILIARDWDDADWGRLAASTRPAKAAWIGPVQDFEGEASQPQLPELESHFGSLCEPSIELGNASVAAPSHSERAPTKAHYRPQSIVLENIAPGDLVAVSTVQDGQSVVTALQPACLRDERGGLSLPLPPRFATVAEQCLDVHLISELGGVRGLNLTAHTNPTAIQSWMLSAFLNRGGAGNPVVTAFAQGAGCRIAYAEDELDETESLGSIPVVWGVLRGSDAIIARAKAKGLHFYYIDHAYFDRGHGKSYRITRNGYEAGPVRKCPDDRFRNLGITIEPWRKSGRSIIVCPPTDFFAAAHNCENWLDDTLAQLRLETDRPILIRTKPRTGEPFLPLQEALLDAHALVTHSSNVAIEAACLGTPVFVSPTSAAAPIGRTDFGMIESPRYPKRDGWLAHLAYSQFTLEEFASGAAWALMREHEERDFV
ncbi:glycoside hydrolase family 43 protein [Novosphingobium ginsenosidimutans]|uniref:Glycoside hydrolase family 43 protein n=1 Tax=Novosphingobium ginsenosidimutans TaxID=1176536 RepID=A0A5B8S2Y8_9SPHN|nr:glycoside hydrolase family 43 protein [Novosphingobium ginsenosidimutans]QEA15821.1 glycoside hydrolase family 43 protein [Novosphingobium ginsenosidimutans]